MSSNRGFVLLGFFSLVLWSCDAATSPAAPDESSSDLELLAVQANTERQVSIMDACDPVTFNAAIGPGTCIRNGGVTFAKFLEQLERHQKAGGWFNAPMRMSARAGDVLEVVNRGGEEHTFTAVAQFGGGFVPILNDLTGNPVPAPECLQLGVADFVPPDGLYTTTVTGSGEARFMCCIHPWMKTTVKIR